MDKNENDEDVIDIDCFCGGAHCGGNIYISKDTINKQKLLMVTVVDTNGSEEGSMWLSKKYAKQLVEELNIMIEKYL